MADSPWRKSIRESTVKNRVNTVNWAAKMVVHSDLLTALVLGTAAVFAVVMHMRGEDNKAEWWGAAIALPWVVAVWRHRRICRPCPRSSRGG